jgi:hypothetical protein
MNVWPAVNVEFKFLDRLRQMNDRVDAVSKDWKPKQAERLHCVKWAQDNTVLVFLLLHDVNGCQKRLKTNHIDRI